MVPTWWVGSGSHPRQQVTGGDWGMGHVQHTCSSNVFFSFFSLENEMVNIFIKKNHCPS
jgi:hypothetical protein